MWMLLANGAWRTSDSLEVAAEAGYHSQPVAIRDAEANQDWCQFHWYRSLFALGPFALDHLSSPQRKLRRK